MQSNQISAARLVLGLSKVVHITPVLENLHWLPIKYSIQFKIMTIVYNTSPNAGPDYICDLMDSKSQNILYARPMV